MTCTSTRTLPLAALTLALAACASSGGADVTGPAYAPPALTMPSAALVEDRTVSRIAFGSCNKQYSRQDFWDAVADTRPDLFVYLGDNVYGDVLTDDPALPELRAAYYRLAASEEFERFRDAVPVLPVWDDHDYGLNDAGGEFPLKRASEALFEDVWALPPDDPRRARDGVHHAVTVGEDGRRVQIILLDTRFFRSALTETDERGAVGKERYLPSADPAQTMLGEKQEAWLADALGEPADLRILVSTVQVIADGHGWEAWATMPQARQRLYDMVAQAQSGDAPVILVSGDRHRGGFYRTNHDGETLIEMTASSLNASFADFASEEPGPNRLGSTVLEENFGLAEIDWDAGEVELTLRGMDGGTFQTWRVELDD